MAEDEPSGFLDQAVALLARAMTSVGLNGNRLLWRWRQRRMQMQESRARREVQWRSTKGRHKMCPSCRSLVERSAATCPDCGTSLSGVSTPGVGRYVTNLLPGVTTATSLLMLVNGFWFVMMILAQIKAGEFGGGGLMGGFDMEMGVRFGAGISRPRLLSDGLVAGGEWWRFVTPVFLHWGLLHFIFNSYMLIQLGPIVEELYGTTRFWPIYLACGISGTVASMAPRFVITAGASGAIMGLIGLLLVYGYRSGGVMRENMKRFAGRLLIYMVIMAFMFNIDHLNHGGGFICGALCALIVPTGPFRSSQEATTWKLLSLGGVVLVLLAFYNVASQARLGPVG